MTEDTSKLELLAAVIAGELAKGSYAVELVTIDDGAYTTRTINNLQITNLGDVKVCYGDGAYVTLEPDTEVVERSGWFSLHADGDSGKDEWVSAVAPPEDGRSYKWSYNENLSEDIWTPVDA